MELLTTSSAMEQRFYEWVPVLFVLCTRMHVQVRGAVFYILQLVSRYSADWQLVAIPFQQASQCANNGTEEEDC